MIDIIANFFVSVPKPKTEALAKQVADASHAPAIQLVAGSLSELSLAEARGYVRARCGRLVRRQTRLAIHGHPEATAAWAPVVVDIATERLIAQVLRDSKVGMPRLAEVRAAA